MGSTQYYVQNIAYGLSLESENYKKYNWLCMVPTGDMTVFDYLRVPLGNIKFRKFKYISNLT